MDYTWPGNIRELENLVKRYTIVGNEAQIIRELSTHKPIVTSMGSSASPIWGLKEHAPTQPPTSTPGNGSSAQASVPPPKLDANGEIEMPSLLEIGKRAAMLAEREAIEKVLQQTRWNRRQAAKILKISYKALLNKLKIIEEQNQLQSKHVSS
jgi:two-component system, NtrC family, response regulator AtoC